jgi:predicted amidophosphoribosyltransferase
MKCPNCQDNNREEAKFCNECGEKLEITCSKCGNPSRLGSNFCDNCGQQLQEQKEIPPIDYTRRILYKSRALDRINILPSCLLVLIVAEL